MTMTLVRRWIVGLAVITALALGVFSGSWGHLGMNRAEAASHQQYQCEDADRYEQFIVNHPLLGVSGHAQEWETISDQFLVQGLAQCGSYTTCGDLSDSGNHFRIPMTIWDWPQDCGSSAGAGLPSLGGNRP